MNIETGIKKQEPVNSKKNKESRATNQELGHKKQYTNNEPN